MADKITDLIVDLVSNVSAGGISALIKHMTIYIDILRREKERIKATRFWMMRDEIKDVYTKIPSNKEGYDSYKRFARVQIMHG